jgi:hypothetical protein
MSSLGPTRRIETTSTQSITAAPCARAQDIQALAQAGATTLIVNVTALELEPMLERMETFATDVMPLING